MGTATKLPAEWAELIADLLYWNEETIRPVSNEAAFLIRDAGDELERDIRAMETPPAPPMRSVLSGRDTAH